MKELRLVRSENGGLILESPEGEQLLLVVDDATRSAVRAASYEAPSDLTITPREIQERIRNGASVDELAAISGASTSFIEKFAKPIFDELQHMIDSALAIRITIAGDRYNDEVQEEFGRIIESRLFASHARNVTWMSRRVDPLSWQIIARYEVNGVQGEAVWIYIPRQFHLTPDNDAAVTLSNHDSSLESPIPKLRSVAVDSAQNFTQAPISEEPADVPAAFRRETEVDTTDLLAEIRKRREEETKTPVIEGIEPVTAFPETLPEPELQPEPEPEPEPEPQSEEDLEPVAEAHENETSTADQTRKGRAAMPSWDEIVFGARSDD